MLRADFKSRPYDLRHHFGTQLMLAEPKGFLRDRRVFMMGHMGDIEHVYTLNKHNLRDDVVEKMRDGYVMATDFLETSTVKESGPAKDEVLREVLDLFEFSPDEASKTKPGDVLVP